MKDHAALTDVGRTREHNEDAYAVVQLLDGLLCAVADGMGGHAAGEVASRIAIEKMEHAARAARLGQPLLPELQNAADAAHAAIREAAQDGREGMGCTLTVVAVRPGKLELLHIGDSRAYLLHDGAIEQLTDDDTLVGEMQRQALLTEAEAREHPARSVLTRALGVGQVADFSAATIDSRPGDLLLLCSDGLTGHLTDDELLARLDPKQGLEPVAKALVAAANEAGGSDNVTVVLARTR